MIRWTPRAAVDANGGPVWALVMAVLIFTAGIGAAPAAAQTSQPDTETYAMVLRDVPLPEALDRFIETTRADIAYSTGLVRGKQVYCRIRNAGTEQLLRCILDGTGIDYLRTSGGTYLLVEGVRAPDAKGDVAGTVVDAHTGEPLPQANVLLASASTGTTTSPAGRFQFASVLPGTHRLVVTYVGYATAVDTIRVTPNRNRSVRIALEPRVLQGEPVIVDGLQQRLPSRQLGSAFAGEGDLQALAASGTLGGLKSVSRRTGVSLNRPRADLNVQGGADGENVTLLDGAPVREPLSLGGLLSAFSPKALDRIVVHKTGFDASEGSSIAGVVDATHDVRAGTPGGGPAAGVSGDVLSVNARGDVGWRAREMQSGSAMLSARRSVWEAYPSPSLHRLLNTWTQLDPTLTDWWVEGAATDQPVTTRRSTSDVRFADLHAAVRQDLSPFQSVYASAYHGTSRIRTASTAVLGEATQPTRHLATENETEWTNTAVQIRTDRVVSERATARLQLYASRHDSHTFFGLRDTMLAASAPPPEMGEGMGALDDPLAVDHAAEGNRLDEVGARLQADVSLSPRMNVEAAVEPQWLSARFDIRNRFLGALGHESRAWHVGSYVEGTASLGLGTTVTLGTRLTYVPVRRTVYAEPRASVRLDRAETTVGSLAMRLGGGVYRQYVLQSEISSAGPMDVVPSMQFWLPLDGSVAPPRAYHAAADVLVRPSEAWTVRLETYAKWQPRTLSVDYAARVRPDPLADARTVAQQPLGRQADLMAAGDGRAVGAALQVGRDGRRVSADAAVEVSRVHRRYPGRFGDRYVPAPWEEPLRASANVGVTVVDGVQATASWRGSWNRPWALRRSYYDYLAQTTPEIGGVDLQRPGEQRLAPFSRFDLGLETRTTLRGVGIEARAGIVNVFDRANPFDESLHPGGNGAERVARTLPGRRLFLLIGIRL